MTLETSRGDRYALSALRNQDAALPGVLGACRCHVAAPGPGIQAPVPTKRPIKRVKLFRQGELGRMILGTLREADEALSTREIVTAVIAKGGHGEAARRALGGRIRGNLAYLQRRSVVLRIGEGRDARWRLA